MNVHRVLQVRQADPLGSFRSFLTAWWSALDWQAILAPIDLADQSSVAPQPIDQADRLAAVNPFTPIMVGNAAALVEPFARDRAGQRLAVILRPCELRTLIELRKRRRAPAVDAALRNHTLTVIGVDCVATYSAEDYAARRREYGAEAVTREALLVAGDAARTPCDLRAACQVCDWPAPRGADVTIGVIGVAPEQVLLVIARDAATDDRLRLSAVTAGLATEHQVAQREAAVGDLIGQRAATRAGQLGAAAGNLMGLARLLSWVSNCTLCGDCLDACPLYNGELAGLLGVGGPHRGTCGAPLADFVEMARWLTSCSGCGMCEAACEHQVPVGGLASALSYGLRGGLPQYVAGDPDRPLPWGGAERGR